MADSENMARCGNSFGWFDVALSLNKVVCDSTEVIMRRTMDLASGRMDAEEAQRMVVEKPLAFALAAQMGTTAALMGGSPSWVTETTIATIADKVSENATRLRDLG